MKDVIINKPTGMDSLGRKFALVVFIAIVSAGLGVGYLVLEQQRELAFTQQQQVLQQQAEHYASLLNETLLQKERKAIAANQVVMQTLARQKLHAVARLTPSADGSIRSDDGYSAAFIAAPRYNNRTAALFDQTATLWQQLSPLMLQDFFNFYFILFTFTSNIFRSSPFLIIMKLFTVIMINLQLFICR